MSELMSIPLDRIRENPEAIRTVDKTGEEYIGLVDSIRSKGFNGSISVREIEGDEDGVLYAVVDGMHRTMAAKDAGLAEIPCSVAAFDEAEAIEFSIMANVHKKDTTVAEYRQGLIKLLKLNPMMTNADLAEKMCKSTQWVGNILSLNKIDNDEIISLIDEGKITLSNAVALAKLPPEEMVNYITEAQPEAPNVFIPKVDARAKEIKDAKRQGKNPEDRQFIPSEFLQKMRDIKEARDTGELATQLLGHTGIADPAEAFKLALNWVLHVDPISIEEQKAQYEQKLEAQKAKKAEREAKRAAKAKEKAAEKMTEAEEAEAKAREAAEAAAAGN